jgi:hypothetical protein
MSEQYASFSGILTGGALGENPPLSRKESVLVCCESPISAGSPLYLRVAPCGDMKTCGAFSGTPGDGLVPWIDGGWHKEAISDSFVEKGGKEVLRVEVYGFRTAL